MGLLPATAGGGGWLMSSSGAGVFDLGAEGEGGDAGGVLVVGAGRGVADGAAGADEDAGAVGVESGLDGGFEVAALGADARDEDREVGRSGADVCHLGGVGGADDEANVAGRVPLVG